MEAESVVNDEPALEEESGHPEAVLDDILPDLADNLTDALT